MANLPAKTRKLLIEFEAAVRADEMKGAQPPEDRQGIEQRLELAETRLHTNIKELIK